MQISKRESQDSLFLSSIIVQQFRSIIRIEPHAGGILKHLIKMKWHLSSVLAVLFSSLCLFYIVCRVYSSPIYLNYLNSDTLLPAQFTEFINHHGFHFRTFQLPRVTSLFPDLTIFYVIQTLTNSWRHAYLGMTEILLFTFVITGSAILSRIHQLRFSLCYSILSLIVCTALLIEMTVGFEFMHTRLVSEVMAHGGPFVFSIPAALLLYSTAKELRPWNYVLLLAASAILFVSDQLTFLCFHLPAIVVAIFFVLKRIGHVQIQKVAEDQVALEEKAVKKFSFLGPSCAVILGVALGCLWDSLLKRQPTQQLDWRHIFSRVYSFLTTEPWWVALIFLTIFVTIAAAPFFIVKKSKRQNQKNPYHDIYQGQFFWIFAVSAILFNVIFIAMFLYWDRTSYRYFYPLFWWPLIGLASLILALLSEKRFFQREAIAGLIVVFLFLAMTTPLPPLFYGLGTALGNCLIEHREEYHLGSGLAEYWIARRVSVFSEWKLTVDPLQNAGHFYEWGNDYGYFGNYEGKRPYNFVVMKDLPSIEIMNIYGKPRASFHCSGTEVWVF